MKKSYLTLVILGAILLVALLTNPNPSRHKEAVKTEINAYMQKKIKDGSGGEEATGQALGALIGGALIDRIVDNVVSSDNYLLFSTTKITWEGQSRVIGVGVFGNVFFTGKVNEAMAQASAENN